MVIFFVVSVLFCFLFEHGALYTIRVLAVFEFYYRTRACNLTERENLYNSECLFCFSFEDFRICSRFNNVNYGAWFFCCYLPARLFRNFAFNYRKKAKKKSRKRSNIVQFGRWCDSFSSALCSILS